MIKESGWRGMAKIILVESKGRASGDEMKTKRYVVAIKIGVAISTVLLMTTRTGEVWVRVGDE